MIGIHPLKYYSFNILRHYLTHCNSTLQIWKTVFGNALCHMWNTTSKIYSKNFLLPLALAKNTTNWNENSVTWHIWLTETWLRHWSNKFGFWDITFFYKYLTKLVSMTFLAHTVRKRKSKAFYYAMKEQRQPTSCPPVTAYSSVFTVYIYRAPNSSLVCITIHRILILVLMHKQTCFICLYHLVSTEILISFLTGVCSQAAGSCQE